MVKKLIPKKLSRASLSAKIKSTKSASELKKLQVLLYFSIVRIVDIQFISSLTGMTVAKINNLVDGHEGLRNKGALTPKEKRIIRLLCKGKTNKEIGKVINRSFRSVETMREVIIKKVGAKNTVELIMYALKNNLVG